MRRNEEGILRHDDARAMNAEWSLLPHWLAGEQKDDLHREHFRLTTDGLFHKIWEALQVRDDLESALQSWRSCASARPLGERRNTPLKPCMVMKTPQQQLFKDKLDAYMGQIRADEKERCVEVCEQTVGVHRPSFSKQITDR